MENSGRSTANTKRLVGMALFTAIIVVLQLLGSFISGFLPVTISLVLIPIVVGAAVYGPKSGAYFGFVFGVIVLIACITGADKGGNVLWNVSPIVTAILCLVKGAAAGLVSGYVYKALSRKNLYLAVIVAAIVCPVVNTGIFCGAMALFFHETLVAWAAGSSLLSYTIVGLVGINFLIELGLNVVLCPVICRIINFGKKM